MVIESNPPDDWNPVVTIDFSDIRKTRAFVFNTGSIAYNTPHSESKKAEPNRKITIDDINK